MTAAIERRCFLPGGHAAVRAALDGAKAQFRVPVKPQPYEWRKETGAWGWLGEWAWLGAARMTDVGPVYFYSPEELKAALVECCSYQVGDRLWVPETWRLNGSVRKRLLNGKWQVDYSIGFKGGGSAWKQMPLDRMAATELMWLEDDTYSPRWSPSITMPRWCARLWIEVTEVRCERLQELSEADGESNPWVWVVEFRRVER